LNGSPAIVSVSNLELKHWGRGRGVRLGLDVSLCIDSRSLHNSAGGEIRVLSGLGDDLLESDGVNVVRDEELLEDVRAGVNNGSPVLNEDHVEDTVELNIVAEV